MNIEVYTQSLADVQELLCDLLTQFEGNGKIDKQYSEKITDGIRQVVILKKQLPNDLQQNL